MEKQELIAQLKQQLEDFVAIKKVKIR